MTQLDHRRGFVLAMLLAAVVYVALMPRFLDRLAPLTGDEPFYVMTAISLIRDGDVDESNNYEEVIVERDGQRFRLYRFADELYPDDPLPADWNGWASPPTLVAAHAATTDREGLYSKHGLGLSMLIAVPYELAGRTGTVLLIALMGVLLTGQMYLLGRESGASPGLALAIAAGLAVAMPIGPYALLLFPEVPAALLLIYAVRQLANRPDAIWRWLLAGCAIGFLPWLHQRFAPTSTVLALIALVYLARTRQFRKGVAALLPVLVGGLTLIAYHQWLYGIPVQRVEDHAGFNGLSGAVNGGFGLLLDAQWGLLIAAPVMAFAIAAIPQWLRCNRRLVLVAAAAVAPYLVLVAAYKVWWGEWGPPARYLVPIVPLAAGALGAWLSRASVPGRCIVAVTWGAGMLLTMIGYADPQRFYHHPDGVNRLVGELQRATNLGFERLLVPFQPYSPGTLAERFWISLCALVVLILLAWAIGSVPKSIWSRITRTIRPD
jgi:hypothetical protein